MFGTKSYKIFRCPTLLTWQSKGHWQAPKSFIRLCTIYVWYLHYVSSRFFCLWIALNLPTSSATLILKIELLFTEITKLFVLRKQIESKIFSINPFHLYFALLTEFWLFWNLIPSNIFAHKLETAFHFLVFSFTLNISTKMCPKMTSRRVQ